MTRRPDPETAKHWKTILSPYWGADTRRSVIQVLTSAIAFFVLWYAAYRSLEVGYWLTLLLAVPAGGFLMRLFLIQHDCGHGSFFKSQKVANALGSAIGVLTLTPYAYWRKTHAHHHAHSGDLGFRGFGDVDTFTVREFNAMSAFQRFAYRVHRNPFVLFGIGALLHFIIKHRYPWDIPHSWKGAWRSVWLTNLALAGVVAIMWSTIGLAAFLMVGLPVLAVSTTLGVGLFYVQHQYEDTYWHEHENWDYFDAGLHGSSHLVLPAPLQWMTASIGLHHVHHLSARIPNYKLQRCLDENPELQATSQITLWSSLKTLSLALWDEDQRKLVSFRDARAAQIAS